VASLKKLSKDESLPDTRTSGLDMATLKKYVSGTMDTSEMKSMKSGHLGKYCGFAKDWRTISKQKNPNTTLVVAATTISEFLSPYSRSRSGANRAKKVSSRNTLVNTRCCTRRYMARCALSCQ